MEQARYERRPVGESGSAMLVAMMVASTMLSLGLGLVAAAATERAMAANVRMGAQALYASEALAEYVAAELMSDASWTPALAGARRSAFLEPTSSPVAPWNEPIDLAGLTSRLQQASDIEWPGADAPRWQLFAAGSFAALSGSVRAAPIFMIAWIADDPADNDGDPGFDSDEVLMVRVQGHGPGGLHRTLHLVLRRTDEDDEGPLAARVRVLSWREMR
jgi:hypothetical protein